MKKNASKITDLLALTVFAVFAVCVLVVLLYGGQVYQNLIHSGSENSTTRIAAQYVSMRVRQAEQVAVTDFDGCEALTIREQIGETGYVTRVYCYDGYIRELYCAENAILRPEDGEKVMPSESLGFSIEADLLTAFVNGQTILLQLRGKAGGAP